MKIAFFIVTTMSHCEQLLGGFWFLKSLFVGSMFFYFATKITLYIEKEYNYKIDYLVGGMLLAATLLFGFVGNGIPFVGVDAKDFMAGFFIWSGYMYCKHKCTFHNRAGLL